ncbi:MAG: sigma-70 family RNA polymerase sigma factor [Planctomycetota bacterium]
MEARHQRAAGPYDKAIARHADTVRERIVKRLGRGDPDVDDVTQDALARGLASASSIEHPGAVRSWLLTVADRTAYDHLRARGRGAKIVPLPTLDELEQRNGSATSQAAIDLEFWQLVTRQIERLPNTLRECARRYFLRGESLAAISKALGESKSTVHRHVQHTQSALANRLSGAGFGAFVPLLDVASGHPATATPLLKPSRRQAWLGLAAAALLTGALLVLLQRTPAVPAVAASHRADLASATVKPHAAPQERDASDAARRRATLAPGERAIFGTIHNPSTGEPVAAAVVHAFDYLHLRTTEAVTNASGEFCIESTRGLTRPFYVYVTPPPGSGLGQKSLDALVPSVQPVDVCLLPTIDIILTVFDEQDPNRYWHDVEVTVVELSRSDLSWPTSEGFFLRQLAPAQGSILQRRHVTGPLYHTRFDGVPRCSLGFILKLADGRIAQANHYPPADESWPPEHHDGVPPLHISICSPSYASTTSWHGLSIHSLRARQLATSDSIERIAEPDLQSALEQVGGGAYAGWKYRSESDSPSSIHADGIVRFHPTRQDSDSSREEANGPATDFGTVRIDLRSLVSPQQCSATDELGIVITGDAGRPTIFAACGGHRTDQPVVLTGIPLATPLALTILSADFENTLYEAFFDVAPSDRLDLDLNKALVDTRVNVRDGKDAVTGANVFIEKDLHRSFVPRRSHVWCAETNEFGSAAFAVHTRAAKQLRIERDHSSGPIHFIERIRAARISAEYTYDLATGFSIRLLDGADWYTTDADTECYVEGTVTGDRKVRFRKRVQDCPDGKFFVPTGVAGTVNARIVLPCDSDDLPTNAATALPRVVAFQTDARPNTPTRNTLVVQAASRAGDVRALCAHRIELVNASGTRLALADLHVQLAVAATDGNGNMIGDGHSWQPVAWYEQDGCAVFHQPNDHPDFELLVLTKNYVPVRILLPRHAGATTRKLTARLLSGNKVSLWAEWTYGADALDSDLYRGVHNGDLLHAVNGQRIHAASDFETITAQAPANAPLNLQLIRQGKLLQVDVPPPWQRFLDRLRLILQE